MRRIAIISLYVLLLIASHLVRRLQPPAAALEPGQRRIEIPETNHGVATGRSIELAYWDIPSRGTADSLTTPLLILHGSPVATPAMQPFIHALRGDVRLIAPDLPGFGASTRVVADYSFDAHARACLALLDHLGVRQVHVEAYSMAGGVAVELDRLAPERVASLVFHSALGVQELELLGDYSLNHTLHGLQYAFLWALQECTPHFGWLDQFPLNTSYARNFLDSDQRPLRAVLENYAGPMLILHGLDDMLVPVVAAREHARIVPQSEEHEYPGGHLLVITNPEAFAGPTLEFLHQVEAGTATVRSTAEPRRQAAAARPFDWQRDGARGPSYAWIAATLLAVATLVSEDLACISGGLLVARGALGFWIATLGCLGGIVLGDVLLFLAGSFLGARALCHRPWRWFLTPARVEQCAALFRRRGAVLVLTARFLPGLRLPTYFAAGVTGMRLRVFLGYFLIAAILWTPLLVGAAVLVGDPLLAWSSHAGHWGWLLALCGLLAFWLMARAVVLAMSRRGRRLLLGWWRRRIRWEFWPPWLVYPPVVVYVLWLACRHHSLIRFTAANPGIKAGGWVGESKSAILGTFPSGTPEIARFSMIAANEDAGKRFASFRAFMEREQLEFPVVFKPDIGERGQGVAVVRDATAASDYLRRCTEAVIAQEYVDGREFGLFYARRPSEPRGRIISITAKHLPTVRGDGRRSLEELILDDERAVCLAPFFLRKLAGRLGEVPPLGAEVRLTDLGTHCRGAMFGDGRDEVWSEVLEAKLDAVSRQIPGFYFGRFDVRTPSAEALRERGEFKVLEVNGVTSECTHIYAPGSSLWQAWRVLLAQWRLAFEIGAENHANGAPVTRVRDLVRLIVVHFGRQPFEA